MKLIFIRHGDPDYTNDTVTERGIAEARALIPRIAKWDIDKIYCSPLGRARDTARIALDGSRDFIVKDFLREFYVPVIDPVSGKTRIPWDFLPKVWTEHRDMYDKDKWHKSDIMSSGDVTAKFGEVCRGIDGILAEYGYTREGEIYRTEKGSDRTAVFFCHLGVQFVILSHLLGIAAPVLWQNFFVAPTSVTTVATEERERGYASFRCKALGDTSHLFACGIQPSDSGFFGELYSD